MRTSRVVALALAVLAAGAIVGVLVVAKRDAETTPQRSAVDRTLEVRTSLEPRVHLFGDPVTAHVDVQFDARRIRPETVRVDTLFRPYTQVGPERRERSDIGRMVRLRFSYALQCLSRACSPGAPQRQIRFPPIRVMYILRDAQARATDTADWPPIDVASRLAASDIREARWRADLEPPPVGYRLSPGWLAAGLGGSALLLALVGSLLAWRLLERGRDEEVEEEPAETRPPLERVLDHIGAVSSNGAVPERRRALERLARELDATGRPTLAARARRLAWAPGQPEPTEIARLVADVRGTTEADG